MVRPSIITPEEAIAMVDEVLRSHGVEPSLTLLPSAWRRFSVGPLVIYSGVVPSREGIPYLQVLAPVMKLPEGMDLGDLFHQMLVLNHFQTRSVRFSVDEGSVIIGIVRPILGLDPDEVDNAIETVVTHAGAAHAWIKRVLPSKARRKLLPPEALPRVPLKPREMREVNGFLFDCPRGTRRFICRLMERWEKAGYRFAMSAGSIHLKAPLGQTQYTMLAVNHSLTEESPRLILSWEGLRRLGVFADEAVAAYQNAICSLTPLETTESAAHVILPEGVDIALASKLVVAMDKLLHQAAAPAMRAPGEVTVANIEATLAACDPGVQDVFRILIGGWQAGGGTLRATRPGRISLKMEGVRPDRLPGTSQFALATLSAPSEDRLPAIDLGWRLAEGDYPYLAHIPEAVQEYERACSSSHGFEIRGSVTRIVLDKSFSTQQANTLLGAMLALKSAAEAKR